MNAARAGMLDRLATIAEGIITMELAAREFERQNQPGWASTERLYASLEASRAEGQARSWWAYRDDYGL